MPAWGPARHARERALRAFASGAALAAALGAGAVTPLRAQAPADSSLSADPASGAADSSAEGHIIRRVDILPGAVFDPVGSSILGGIESLGNRLHVRTRAVTIRRQLLFEPGNRWSEARARETARNLRALDYLDPRRVEGRLVGDSVDAVVQTRDLWTTTPRFDIASADGRGVGSIGLTERNLAGYGKSVSVFYRDDLSGKSWNFAYDDPNLVGRRERLHWFAGKGSEGASDQVSLGLPFYSERTVRAYWTGWGRSTFVNHLFSGGVETANFDERTEHVELWYGGRLPDPVQSVPEEERPVRRLIGAFELLDRRLGPSRLLPGAPPSFAGEEENIRIRQLTGELTLWRPRFIERRNIDRFDRVEDFDVGPQFALKLGFAPRALGSTEDEGVMRIRLAAGIAAPFGFGWVRTSASSRFAPQSIERIAELGANWYSPIRSSHTIALAALGISGTNTPRDFQVVLGGLNGLRAYPINAVAGQRVWRLNAEERWRMSPPGWKLFILGSAAFFDAGRAWGAGAENTGWFRDAGAGIRLGIPSWGLSDVMRLDVAWPIEPSRDGGHRPVLSIGSSQAF